MKNVQILAAVAAISLAYASPSFAVNGVNPSGVNVNAGGVTTVFLTFQNLNPNETPQESFWCGSVTVTGVSAFDPCVPGTVFGRLPARHDLSRVSGAGGFRNFTDIMTIPASVARRAYQQAETGGTSDFFYVRRFSDGINDTFVTVTCRMAGGGARVPLALTTVEIAFDTEEGKRPVSFIGRGEPLPPFSAELRYNGGGQLRGRWEIVQPGDVEPSVQDLLTEATLPVELRGSQQRYSLVERFNVFLPPTGSYRLLGPEPKKIRPGADGPYKILLRIEASADKEGNSNTLDGVVVAGGVAGFPLPVLQFYIGTPEMIAAVQSGAANGTVSLLTPAESHAAEPGNPLFFSWLKSTDGRLYRLEIRSESGENLLTAMLTDADYSTPPWLFEQPGTVYWRVSAYDDVHRPLGESRWRALEVRTATP